MEFESDVSFGAAGHGVGGNLSRRRKAALIVQLLISDGGKLSLSSLPEHLQETLALELGAIRLVDRETVNAVAEEFASVLESVGLSAPGGAPAAINALKDNLSPSLAGRLQARFGQNTGDDPWAQIGTLDANMLKTVLTSESINVAAVTLSKLPLDRAAAALSALPGDRARKITLAISQTAEIAPDAVERIGRGLVADYCKPVTSAFDLPPVDRVGAILNVSSAATREDLLTGLDNDDANFAKNVRRAIFTFANIPERIAPTDVPNCLRAIDGGTMSTALAYAMQSGGEMNAAAEFMLSNISQRMADQMREDANGMGKVKPQVGEEAMNEITSIIRAQVDNGDIKWVEPEEDEEDEAAAA